MTPLLTHYCLQLLCVSGVGAKESVVWEDVAKRVPALLDQVRGLGGGGGREALFVKSVGSTLVQR